MMGEHMKQKFQVYLCVWPKQCMAKTQLSLDSVQYAVVQTEIEKTALPKNQFARRKIGHSSHQIIKIQAGDHTNRSATS